ncbi:MAG: hypothetical protein M3N95_09415 [Actinomycetota bacterium]|nr:hypothetical protein [Actinomycetota bacterium]
MSAIVVSCDRWLGLGSKYSVRVDGREVGRLGRRAKSVRANVDAGPHSVLVEYNGNKTPAQHLDLAQTDEVRFTLDFGAASALVARNILMPWNRHISQPIGAIPPGFMTLSRSN